MRSRVACVLAVLAGWSLGLSAQTPAPCPMVPPVLTRPASGEAGVQSPVEFKWTNVSGATFYHLIVSLNGGTPSTIAVTRDNEYVATIPAGSVEWWVVATAPGCTEVPSLHSQFTAAGPIAGCPGDGAAPQQIAPANGATNLTSPVTFSWTAVNGATEYKLWAFVNSASPVRLGETTNTQLTVPLPGGTILWYVEADFTNCPSLFSGRFSLTVGSGGSCNNNSPTTLLAPANNASNLNSPVTFQWSPVSGATAYKLFVLSSSVAPDLVGITTETSLIRLVPEGAVTWWVDTSFPGCPDVRSAQFHFAVATPSTCTGTISLVAPANGSAVSSPVTLAWTPVANATNYRIWVSLDGAPATIVARSSNTTEKISLPSGNVDWYVEAQFAQCPSITSPRGKFTVSKSATCSTNAVPVPSSPANGAQQTSPVDFEWSSVSGALLYRVWVSVNGDPFVDLAFTRDHSLKDQNLPAGTIQWYVEAFFDACPPLASPKATFVIPPVTRCGGGASLLVTPADGANSVSPVTLVWTAISSATEYRVFASVDGINFALIAKTDNTSIARPLPPGTYTWFVESVSDQCPGTRSAKSGFTVARASTCSSAAPQLVEPADGANNAASPVRFAWNPVSGAVAYSVLIRYNGGAPTRMGETTDSELKRQLPEGSFEWWVIAFFSGCPAVESNHGTFVIPTSGCDSRRPLNQSPVDGATGLGSMIRFAWSQVPKAKSYKVWAAIDDQGASVIGTTTADRMTVALPPGPVQWYVEALFDNCPSTTSAVSAFAVRQTAPPCSKPDSPRARVPAQVESGTAYNVRWTAVANSSSYEVQESTTLDFQNASTQVINDISASLTHTATQPTRYFYRVRAISNCSDDHGPYSKVVSAVVIPEVSAQRHTTVEIGAQAGIVQQVFVAGQDPPVTFSVRADKPWLTVTPATGTLGPQGVTFTVTSDPASLHLGTNTGTILLTYGGGAAGSIRSNGVAPANVPVSVSLVTPVSSTGKNTPPPDSLIIPAVGHATGLNDSLFESDVRVLNLAAQTMKYQLNFTLSGTDGTQGGNSTTIEIEPGATMALDDILTNFFGHGSDGGAATGTLEIRPLTSSTTTFGSSTPNIQTVASSRTFNTTPTGTFGQFIPAVPFSQFIGKSADPALKNILSLQQVAQSAAYRTNFGLVEGAGESASVLVHVFNDAGGELAQIPLSLQPGEHKQLNEFLKNNGITTLNDGRLEVEVTSATGKVTAYASVLDNVTNDPLLVSPALKSSITSTRYVLPGVGDFDIGFAHWKSDVRLFNSASTSVPVTLTYSEQGDPLHPHTSTTTLQAGEVRAIDNLIHSLTWSPAITTPNTAGSLVVSSSAASSLVATARTYTQGTSGTYGQFIPAVTPSQAVGLGERNLQLLQLESSDRFRTNIGLAETSGSFATAHVSLILPDSKLAIATDIPMAPNEFRQISLAGFGAGTVYNGRVTVSVTGGSGRVTAYGSVIDQQTQDPTYVPAQ